MATRALNTGDLGSRLDSKTVQYLSAVGDQRLLIAAFKHLVLYTFLCMCLEFPFVILCMLPFIWSLALSDWAFILVVLCIMMIKF